MLSQKASVLARSSTKNILKIRSGQPHTVVGKRPSSKVVFYRKWKLNRMEFSKQKHIH